MGLASGKLGAGGVGSGLVLMPVSAWGHPSSGPTAHAGHRAGRAKKLPGSRGHALIVALCGEGPAQQAGVRIKDKPSYLGDTESQETAYMLHLLFWK